MVLDIKVLSDMVTEAGVLVQLAKVPAAEAWPPRVLPPRPPDVRFSTLMWVQESNLRHTIRISKIFASYKSILIKHQRSISSTWNEHRLKGTLIL